MKKDNTYLHDEYAEWRDNDAKSVSMNTDQALEVENEELKKLNKELAEGLLQCKLYVPFDQKKDWHKKMDVLLTRAKKFEV